MMIKKKILIQDEFGIIFANKTSLLAGIRPTIVNAIDKNKYFEAQARIIHKDKYDYSKVNYIKARDYKICIICPIHGEFWQESRAHLDGQGCPECGKGQNGIYNNIKKLRNKKEWLNKMTNIYIIQCNNDNEIFYKIGITNNIKNRFNNSKMPYSYKVLELYKINLYEAVDMEKDLQNSQYNFSYIPNIKFNGWTECFSEINFEKIKEVVFKWIK